MVPSWLDNEADLTAFLLDLKRTSPEASSLFESMGWVEDGIGSSTSGRVLQEVSAASKLRDMWQLGLPGQELFLAVLHKPWLRDELSTSESNVVVYITYVLKYDPDLALSPVQMPFLDTVEGILETSISYLVSVMLYRDSTALQRLLSSEDFDDGITDDHVTALELIVLESEDPEMAAAIKVLPWVQDGTDLSEWEEVNGLIDLARRSDLFFRLAMDSTWVRDGLSPDELITLESFSRDRTILGREDPESVAAIEALPWVQDGVDEPEWSRAQALMRLGLESNQGLRAVMERHWTQDGLSADETSIIDSLTDLFRRSVTDRLSESEVLGLLDMPFLESVDGIDAAAIRNLRGIWLSREDSPWALFRSHPSLSDGITDDEASILAILQIVDIRNRSWLPEVLFDPEQTSTSRLVISLPLAGEITLVIVEVGSRRSISMRTLERIVRAQEEIMGVPFPTSFVALLTADATRSGGGGSRRGVITVDPGFEGSPNPVSHEVGHIYWSHSHISWIDEGGASLMEKITLNAMLGTTIGPPFNLCTLAENIGEFEQVVDHLYETEPESVFHTVYGSGCPYSLGQGLFLELYRELGSDTFRPAFASLYTKLRDREHDDRCTGLERGICYVRASFVEDATPEAEAIAVAIIDKWYHGSPPMRKS